MISDCWIHTVCVFGGFVSVFSPLFLSCVPYLVSFLLFFLSSSSLTWLVYYLHLSLSWLPRFAGPVCSPFSIQPSASSLFVCVTLTRFKELSPDLCSPETCSTRFCSARWGSVLLNPLPNPAVPAKHSPDPLWLLWQSFLQTCLTQTDVHLPAPSVTLWYYWSSHLVFLSFRSTFCL